WIRDRAEVEPRAGHVEAFFAENVLEALADELAAVAAALDEAGDDGEHALSPSRVRSLARRLTRIFGAEVAVFERKRFREPSHE
ncbi:hypothetical protein, partial [Klebsiella pneumoniae]|uniref:hypothetical protein n=1 Tax=Klebsiella pneumoniae TaxID=573 RepID=UPI00272F3519